MCRWMKNLKVDAIPEFICVVIFIHSAFIILFVVLHASRYLSSRKQRPEDLHVAGRGGGSFDVRLGGARKY